MGTITQLGNEASRATKNSITSAFSSIFRSKKSGSSSTSNPNSPANNSSNLSMSSSRSSISAGLPDSTGWTMNNAKSDATSRPLSRFGSEVRGYAMAAVILEEWLQELAAIAQEQSVLMKEIAFHVGMALDSREQQDSLNISMPAAKKNSAIITDHPV